MFSDIYNSVIVQAAQFKDTVASFVAVFIFMARRILKASVSVLEPCKAVCEAALPRLATKFSPLQILSNYSNSRLNRTSCSDSGYEIPRVSLLNDSASI